MAYFDDNADVLLFTCPGCGAVHRIVLPVRAVADVANLSDVARSILAYSGPNCDLWRRGRPVALRTWAMRVYADPHRVQSAMRELVQAGLATTIPYGTKGRVQYVGVPSMLQRYIALAA